MEKTGFTRKHKIAEDAQRILHAKWLELDHIVSELSLAAHSAHYPYVAREGKITPAMQMALDKFLYWCERHYGEKA